MSRTYALSLICTTLTLMGGVFYGQYRYLTDGRVETAAYAAEVHERVIAGQLEEMGELAQVANERMRDETKGRFRPILPFIEDIFNWRDSYLDKFKRENAVLGSDIVTLSRLQ